MIKPVFPTKISQFFGAASVAFMVLVVIAVGLILANSRALEQDTFDESGIGSIQLRVHFEALQGALAMVEAIGRLLPGVVGNAESLVEESHEGGLLEYPIYTKPAVWDGGDGVEGAALGRRAHQRHELLR